MTCRNPRQPTGLQTPFQHCLRSVRLAVAAAVLLLTLGCGGEPPDFSQVSQHQAVQVVEQGDPLARACEYFNRQDEFEPVRGQARSLYHLNEWIKKQPRDEDWQADPLFSKLPSRFSQSIARDELTRLDFNADDDQFLRANAWLRDISQSVVQREQEQMRRAGKPSAAGGGWEALTEQMDARAVEDLRIATWLFDWTIRHIQLDPMPEEAAPAIGPEPESTNRKDSPAVDVQPARPAPGGRLSVQETLLLGHGDALERAKVFLGLVHQQGIDAVMLHPEAAPARRGWLAAVLIHDRLFLFDTELGLPIPGPHGRPVATLAEAIHDSSLIRAMDVEGEPRYPLKQSEIEAMVAYIDAPPEPLSLRMHLLEAALSGDCKMVLTAVPGPLAKSLRRCEGIADVRIWLPPYETRYYRVQLQRLLQQLAEARRAANRQLVERLQAALDLERLHQVDQELSVFVGLTPILRGRILQLRGQFDKRENKPGATQLLMDCRPPEAAIAQLTSDEDVRRELVKRSVIPEDEAPEYLQKAIESRVALVRRMKQTATHWLGLIAYENGNYRAAINFFDQLTLGLDESGPWTDGARYNLARAHESLARQTGERHDLKRALELYRQDKSPQRLGNLVRAQWLAEDLADPDHS